MPDTSSTEKRVTVPVLAYFHLSDPETGDTVFHHPDGDYDEETGKGWPGAKKSYTGDPDSKEFKHLRAGAGGDQGPLIGEPPSAKDEKKTTSTAGPAGKQES